VKYLIQCVSGLQDVVAEELRREPFGEVRVEAAEEGLLVVEAGASPGELKRLPYINNAFMLLGQLDGATVEAALERVVQDERWPSAAARATTPGERTFRIMLQDAGQLVAGPPALVTRALETLGRATGLRRDPRQADSELWLIRRASGKVYFCKRISQRARTEKDLAKGELRPELATLLCLMSEPAPGDVFLDPFAGSGAIPLARAALPYNMIFCFDTDPEKVTALKSAARAASKPARGRRGGSPIIVHLGDARRLERIQDGFADKVVTDPPWGFFDAGIGDPLAFYRAVLAELVRATKPGGIIVMLMGRRELIEPLEASHAGALALVARHDILVAGKKATVLKWRRSGG
jgi:SAM-dependent methyltransferase